MSQAPVRDPSERDEEGREASVPPRVAVYDRPPEADRRPPPLVMGASIALFLALVAYLAVAVL